MTPPGHESKTLSDLLEGDFEEMVDYESDTDFLGPDGSPLTTITGEDDSLRAPHPFPNSGAAVTLNALRASSELESTATVTNPLDEEQQLIVDREESAKRRSKTAAKLQGQRQYVF